MAVKPEWVAIVLTLMGMSGAVGAWVQKQRDRARAALPLVRLQWGEPGEKGYAVSVVVVNRLDEDLLVSRAECRSNFSVAESGPYEPGTGTVPVTYTRAASPMVIAWTVRANSEGEMTFRIDGPNTPRWLRLTVSSSLRTLHNKHLVVSDGGESR